MTVERWLAMPLINAFGYFRGLFSEIREDWVANHRDWTKPGFRAVAVYRFGAILKDRRRGVLSGMLSMLYRCMFRYVRNQYGIELPATALVGRRLQIGHQSGIVIHWNAVIGDDCTIIQNVTIGPATVARHWEAPTLGNRVEVGCGAAILGKVVIGDDVRIGPNVVVTTDIPEGTTVCVLPPRLIKLPRHGQSRSLSSRLEKE